jgi:NTP pyrophosphatase (non-canonical NTP hydrolase)
MSEVQHNKPFTYEYCEDEGLVSILVNGQLVTELADENGDPEAVFHWFCEVYSKTNFALSYNTNTISSLTAKQFNWLNSVGWVGKTTPLEDLMLVVSECGEAANECRGETLTPNFETELADIVLRVMGIAAKNDIDLEKAILAKMEVNRNRGTRGRIK